MASTYTTDCPGDTFPSIVPAKPVVAIAVINRSANKRLRVMTVFFPPGLVYSTLKPLVGEIQTKYERVGVEGIESYRQPVHRIGSDYDRL